MVYQGAAIMNWKRRVAAKLNKEQKKDGPYKDALRILGWTDWKDSQSIRNDRDFKRKKIAAHLGLEDYNVRNMERSHGKIRAGDLFCSQRSGELSPRWLIKNPAPQRR